MGERENNATKSYVSNIVCPHCGERITIRGHFMGRSLPNSIDKAFESLGTAFENVDRAFRRLFP